jgi:hypothetical protein
MAGSTLALVAVLGLAFTDAQAPGPPPVDAPLERMDFVIEFADGRVTHHPVGPRRGSSWTPMFPRVPDWEPAPDGLHPAAVGFVFHRTEEGARFVVSVFLGQAHEKEIAVHEGTLRVGDRVTVERLVEFGVRPVTVGLEPLAPIDFHEPAIVNRTSALQITAVRTIVEPAPRYIVTVENLTERAVDSFLFEARAGGRPALSGVKGNEDGRVIVAPRGIYTFDFPFPTGPGPAQGPWAPMPADELAITSVSWVDGTFEGDPRAAANHRIRLMARRVQVERVVKVLQSAAAADPVIPRALSRLRQQVDGLSIEVDATLKRAGMALLPTSDTMPAADVTASIRTILQRVKSQASEELARVEGVAGKSGADAARRELDTLKQEFGLWLAQLQR